MRDTAGKQTIYDVIIDATIHKLGGWKNVTPEDALRVSQEKSVLDTYNQVSAIFQNESELPEEMADRLGSTSLYDVVISAMALNKQDPDQSQKSEEILEAAKKQTVFEVLLNAMAATKQKMVR